MSAFVGRAPVDLDEDDQSLAGLPGMVEVQRATAGQCHPHAEHLSGTPMPVESDGLAQQIVEGALVDGGHGAILRKPGATSPARDFKNFGADESRRAGTSRPRLWRGRPGPGCYHRPRCRPIRSPSS